MKHDRFYLSSSTNVWRLYRFGLSHSEIIERAFNMIRKNANRQKLQLKDLSSIRWRQLSADLDRLRRKTKPIH